MHEITVARSIVDLILKEAEKESAKKIISVDLCFGELTLVNEDQVEFWIKIFLEEGIGKDIEVNTEKIPGEIQCNECGEKFAAFLEDEPNYHYAIPTFECSKCGSNNTFISQGREMLIKRIRVEK